MCKCTGWSGSMLVTNALRWFCHDTAANFKQIIKLTYLCNNFKFYAFRLLCLNRAELWNNQLEQNDYHLLIQKQWI
jgi:hypothetical protein